LTQPMPRHRHSLVWRPELMSTKFDEVPGPLGKRSRLGDDGMMPPFPSATPSFDLSSFSLSSPSSRPAASSHRPPTIHPVQHSEGSSSTSNSSPFYSSLFSTENSGSHSRLSLNTPMSSARDSPATPPLLGRLEIGPGDDGIPILPRPLPSLSAFISGAIQPRSYRNSPVLPPLRSPDPPVHRPR